jgi:mannosyltransferase
MPDKQATARNRILLTIGLIILIGTALRLYELGAESLWYDEIVRVVEAQEPIWGIMNIAAEDNHPPLHWIMMHYWTYLFGESEVGARSLSALVGILTIPLIFNVTTSFFDAETGLFAALLLAFSRFHVEFSQEARANIFMPFFGLISMLFFWQILRQRDRRYQVGYVLATVPLIYMHYYGLLVVAAQNLFFVLFWSRHRLSLSRWMIVQVIIGLLYLPWSWIILRQIATHPTGPGSHVDPSLSMLRSLLITFSAGTESRLFIFVGLIFLGFVPVLCHQKDLGWGSRLRQHLSGKLLVTVWLVISIVLAFGLSLVYPVLTIRNLLVGLPPFLILVAYGLRNIRPRWFQVLAIVIVVAASLTPFRSYYWVDEKEQWREAARFVDSRYERSDLILFHAPFVQTAFDYYSVAPAGALQRYPLYPGVQRVGLEQVRDLPSVLKGHPRVWLLLSHNSGRDPDNLIEQTLRRVYDLKLRRTFIGIDLSLYQEKQDS